MTTHQRHSLDEVQPHPVSAGPVVQLPTAFGDFIGQAWVDEETGVEHMSVSSPAPPAPGVAPLVRLHSECLTGDVFGSYRCDCGEQLAYALNLIKLHGGTLLYLRGHEGRGIGLLAKLRAYQMQDNGHDTVDANLELGLPVDAREYVNAAQMLADLGVASVRLLTNNPAKLTGLDGFGVEVKGRTALPVMVTEHNRRYLAAKRDRLGHQIGDLA